MPCFHPPLPTHTHTQNVFKKKHHNIRYFSVCACARAPGSLFVSVTPFFLHALFHSPSTRACVCLFEGGLPSSARQQTQNQQSVGAPHLSLSHPEAVIPTISRDEEEESKSGYSTAPTGRKRQRVRERKRQRQRKRERERDRDRERERER